MSASRRRGFVIYTCFTRRAEAAAIRSGLIGQMFASSDDGETFVVEEALNFENCFNVLAAIQAMPTRAFHGLERRKFRLPVAQDKRFCGSQAADFAYAEQTLVRNWGIRRSLSRSSHESLS